MIYDKLTLKGPTFRIAFGITVLSILLLTGSANALSNDGSGIWQSHTDITIINTGSDLTDYQLLINLDNSNFQFSQAQANGEDIRFADVNNVELNYWIESWSAGNAKVWVKVTDIPAGTSKIHMLWGNPSATSSSDGDATFVFFDDFETGNLNKWDGVDEGASIISDNGNYVLKLYAKDGNWYNVRKNIVPSDIRLDLKYKIVQDGAYDGARFGTFLRSNYQYDLADWHVLDIGKPARELDDEASQLIKKEAYYSTLGVWYYWGFSVAGSSSVELKGYGRDGEVVVSAIDTDNLLPAGQLKLWVWDAGATDYIDDVRIRKYTVIEPSVIIDTNPPTIYCALADGLWHGNDVSISCTASDSESGLANSADASFSLTTNVASGEETAGASTDSHEVCDNARNCATAGPITGNKVDKKAPSISIITPTGTYTLNQVAAADYSCADGGSGIAACDGPVSSGSNFDTSAVGTKSFTVNANDNVGNTASATNSYNIIYNWNGFFSPIDNLDSNNNLILNSVKAGSGVPAKFSLNGDQGLGIIATGFPKSSLISCDSNAIVDPVNETVAAGSSGLSYDAIADQYIYVWKTEKAWSNTCRQINVKLIDGTTHVANFKFT